MLTEFFTYLHQNPGFWYYFTWMLITLGVGIDLVCFLWHLINAMDYDGEPKYRGCMILLHIVLGLALISIFIAYGYLSIFQPK